MDRFEQLRPMCSNIQRAQTIKYDVRHAGRTRSEGRRRTGRGGWRVRTVGRRAVLVGLLLTGPSFGQATTRVSVGATGSESDADSVRPSVSQDGRYIAFESAATNLVAGDSNGVGDVFVHDRLTGDTVRMSVSSAGSEGDAKSGRPSISYDGRFVAFFSDASNLVPGDEPLPDAQTCSRCTGARDVFVRDRDPDENGVFDEGNGVTVRVSVRSDGDAGNDESTRPSISGDGRYVAFKSKADNLVDRDTNGEIDVFVHDLQTGTTVRASERAPTTGGNGKSDRPAMSGDGRTVAFFSDASNLVDGDTNGIRDVFVRDLTSSAVIRISVGPDGEEANGSSSRSVLSADGRFVAFRSSATNLVSGDTNGAEDIFIYDRDPDENGVFDEGNGAIALASKAADGPADGDSSSPSISDDGRLIAFHSDATNLVTADRNRNRDVFVLDRSTAEIIRVSVCGAGTEGNDVSERPSLSADGDFVAFHGQASNLVAGDSNGVSDVFERDLQFTGDEGVCGDTSSAGGSGGTRSRGGCGFFGMVPLFVLFASLTALRRKPLRRDRKNPR